MNDFDEEKEQLAAEENAKYVRFLKWLYENRWTLETLVANYDKDDYRDYKE